MNRYLQLVFAGKVMLIVALIFTRASDPGTDAATAERIRTFRGNHAGYGAFARHATPRRHSMSSGEGAMKGLTDKANYDRLGKDLDAVKHDISNLADQVTDALNALAGSTQNQARRGYKQARSNVDAVVFDLSKHGSAAFEQAQEAAGTLGDTLEDAVQQRPLAAVGLALGLGFLIGVTWRR